MSDTRKSINKLVSEKISNRSDRLKEANHESEATGAVLADYDLYFSGALDALAAAGVPAEDFRALTLAKDTNDSEIRLLEHRLALEEALAG